MSEIEAYWRPLAHNNIYANPEYLGLLEEFGPGGYNYYYCVLLENGLAQAAIYFQFKRIQLSKDLRLHTHSDNWLNRLEILLKKAFLKVINQNLLICGNVLLTGEYAFGTNNQYSIPNDVFDQVLSSIKAYVQKTKKLKIHGILSKDFYAGGVHQKLEFNLPGFTEFKVQPAMIIDRRTEWATFEDFLASVKSKYRVKFKKKLKKAEPLSIRSLTVDELEKVNDQAYELYKATADRSTFSLFRLHQKYFLELKRCMGDNLIFKGMFLEDELVGFYTFVINQDKSDAHFVGYNFSLNHQYDIYFNILLGLIKLAINNKSSYLNLSRTALEIKSSVGAEPHEMKIYLRHETGWINKLLPVILKNIVPVDHWQPRSPFK